MGPGSRHRAPLYIITAVDGETGSARVEIVDANGNWVGPGINLTGNLVVATTKTATITDAGALFSPAGVKVPSYIEKDWAQMDATIPASQTVMIAQEALQLVSASCRFSHVGGSSAALSLAKDPSGTAPGGGTGLVTATADLTGGTTAVNVNFPFALSATPANLQFAAGDGFSLVFSGTLTALLGLVVSAQFQRL